jgi:hypothetical protein
VIWLDSSIPRAVAQALSLVRPDIAWVGDLYPFASNRDEVWLADAGRASAMVVARDKKIRTRPRERQAIIQNAVGCFILNQKRNPNRWGYLRLLARSLDEMEDRFASMPRPFICTVDSRGQFQVLYPPRSVLGAGS